MKLLLLTIFVCLLGRYCSLDYNIYRFGGLGTGTSTGNGGNATSATFNVPRAIWQDTLYNSYIVEATGSCVRKIEVNTYIVSGYAGTCGTATDSGDGGKATAATMLFPVSLFIDTTGKFYISQYAGNRVRSISATGIISTFAGTGTGTSTGNGGQATSATFNGAHGVWVNSLGVVYVTEFTANFVRSISTSGIVSLVAGTGTGTFSGDSGPASSAALNGPQRVFGVTSGNLLISDVSNNRVRAIFPPYIGTAIGTGTSTYNGDNLAATSSNINFPTGTYIDPSTSDIYVSELFGNRVRKRSSTGILTTFAGTGTASTVMTDTNGDGGSATLATFGNPEAMYVDSTGRYYITEYTGFKVRIIYSVTPTSQPTNTPSNRPSRQPSRQPTNQPTNQPTSQPSRQPSCQPFSRPTSKPSRQPSISPSTQPTRQPTSQPFGIPSSQPSIRPSSQPSRQPSSQPICHPTSQPSSQPSKQPSSQPSIHPSKQPSSYPTCQPSIQPSISPTARPSCQPTRQPSSQPTCQPSRRPSVFPSSQPSIQPSRQPVALPSSQPSSLPSSQPISHPSSQPSRQPSHQPSSRPSTQPSSRPSVSPSRQPSTQPSSNPSSWPSRQPTEQPSVRPSIQPSYQPSAQPNSSPSMQPSVRPSCQPVTSPSSQPSHQPTCQPSSHPSKQPSNQPSCQPTSQPFSRPSRQPSRQPSSQPSQQPTCQPSSLPSTQPSSYPSVSPTCQSSSVPTSQPSHQPTNQPSRLPSVQPTVQPSSRPSSQPISHPSSQPSHQPSRQPTVQPFSKPSSQPSRQPFSRPSSQPSRSPTRQPTATPTAYHTREPTTESEQNRYYRLLSVIKDDSSVSGPLKIVLPFVQSSKVPSSDGYSDVVLNTSQSGGQSYVVYSSNNFSSNNVALTLSSLMRSSVGFSISPSVSYDYSYRSVGSLGDVNGDGWNDLIIGVPYASRCYVMFGTSDGYVNMNLGFVVHGVSAVDLTGWSVSSAGDVNNDTLSDIIIGAPRGSDGTIRSGAAYVLFGSRRQYRDIYLDSLSSEEGFIIHGEANEDYFGLSVSDAGDVNKDGYDDVIIGAAITRNYFSGASYIVFGGTAAATVFTKPSDASKLIVFMGSAWTHCGFSVAGVGDVNLDGFDDVLIGCVPALSGTLLPQISYLCLGFDSTVANVSSLHLSVYCDSIFGGGVFVSSVQDVNDDNRRDLFIGSNYSVNEGVGYVIQYSLVKYAPTTRPTVMPTFTPSTLLPTLRPVVTVIPSKAPLAPSVIPTRPTIEPSRSPSGPSQLPTVRPSLTTEHPTNCPTSRPSSQPSVSNAPINPTSYPTIRTNLPTSKEPSESPSEIPSLLPSHGPTLIPSFNPSTVVPTALSSVRPRVFLRPSMKPTFTTTHYIYPNVTVAMIQAGTVNRTQYAERGNYIWKNAVNVDLKGRGSLQGDVITVLPNENCVMTIDNFNKSIDILDVSNFLRYQKLSDLNITRGSVIITLPNSQIIKLLNIFPEDLNSKNFQFYVEPNLNKKNSNANKILATACVGAVFVILVITFLYRYVQVAAKWMKEKKNADRLVARQKPLVIRTNLDDNRSRFGRLYDGDYDESLFDRLSDVSSGFLQDSDDDEDEDGFQGEVNFQQNYEEDFLNYQMYIEKQNQRLLQDYSGSDEGSHSEELYAEETEV